MEIFVLSFLVVSLAVLGMAVGALAGRPLGRGCNGEGTGCGLCDGQRESS
jgi:hypothetical protein